MFVEPLQDRKVSNFGIFKASRHKRPIPARTNLPKRSVSNRKFRRQTRFRRGSLGHVHSRKRLAFLLQVTRNTQTPVISSQLQSTPVNGVLSPSQSQFWPATASCGSVWLRGYPSFSRSLIWGMDGGAPPWATNAIGLSRPGGAKK